MTHNYGLNVIFPKARNPFLHCFFVRLQGHAHSNFEKTAAADIRVYQYARIAV